MKQKQKINKMEKALNVFQIVGEEIHMTRDVAIATIFAEIEGELVEADGTAQRHPDDKSNPRVASLLAYTRALETLHSKISRRAAGAIKHADDMAKLKNSSVTAKKASKKKLSKNKK